MNTSQLLLVSSLGLAVNLFGMFAMGGHHHHVLHHLFLLMLNRTDNDDRVGIPIPIPIPIPTLMRKVMRISTITALLSHASIVATLLTFIRKRIRTRPHVRPVLHI